MSELGVRIVLLVIGEVLTEHLYELVKFVRLQIQIHDNYCDDVSVLSFLVGGPRRLFLKQRVGAIKPLDRLIEVIRRDQGIKRTFHGITDMLDLPHD